MTIPTPRYGANYVPSQGWFYSWLDFRADDVRRDFEDLLATIDIAAEFGLDVAVDLLQGHLSSFDFLPSWVLTWHRRSVFADAEVRDGIAAYVARLAGEISLRDNVFALTLGNEVNNLWPASGTTAEQSRRWAAELLEVAGKEAPELLCLHSVFDDAWYAPEHPFHPGDAVELGDLTTVHSWVFNGTSRIDGPLGPATTTHADYLVELAASADPGRAVWLQELGAPEPDVPAADAAEFTRRTLDAAAGHPASPGGPRTTSTRGSPTFPPASTTSACSPWTTSPSPPRWRWPSTCGPRTRRRVPRVHWCARPT
ncbi:hypothetical protein EV193_11212 [Herbihabitans rhizosphaerae]|uniref:Cellulase (Glycosyl hydrolase family 5) n=1 Tax=Herbihabitans rhizosphaerae TaxID=1872711 RepID=A0A4V2ERL6_9PSEU|nr:hypothetical protein [Herbihabitans rhizosphaerae]RZS32379.1 hypothetical protein EV193_11212 [Herbihabitans rhizosphaerae]